MKSNEKFQELVTSAKEAANEMMELVTTNSKPIPSPKRITHSIRKQEIADHLGISVEQLEIVE